MWFSGWAGVARVVLFSFISYVAVVTLIRMFGKRTISKMNPSDFVVTVAIGSTLATFILTKDVAFAEGLAALATLLVLQWATESLTTRSERFRELMEGHPTLLLYRGAFLYALMRREEVNEMEVREALRQNGIADPAGAEAVILEIDGSFSVIQRDGRTAGREASAHPGGAT